MTKGGRMSEDIEVLPAIDDEPDVWVGEHPLLTEDEIAAGNALGASLDVVDVEEEGGDGR